MIRYFKILIYIFLCIFSLWIGGFIYFYNNFDTSEKSEELYSEGIVVFTGSPGRINEGIRMLESKKSKLMLVTGVNESSIEDTKLWIKSKTSKYECCIELETLAKNTRGNAKETIKWINKNNINTIRLVTSSYHILRSELELKKISPKYLIIIKHPVVDKNLNSNFIFSPSYLLLISIEYSKFIISLLKLQLGL